MPAERPSDLVEPFAMLQQRASDVGHGTVPVIRRTRNERDRASHGSCTAHAAIVAAVVTSLEQGGCVEVAASSLMIIDCARYVAGVRLVEPMSLGDAGRLARQPEGFVWVALRDTGADVLEELAAAFGVRRLGLDKTPEGTQRPKLEHHGESTILTVKTVRADASTTRSRAALSTSSSAGATRSPSASRVPMLSKVQAARPRRGSRARWCVGIPNCKGSGGRGASPPGTASPSNGSAVWLRPRGAQRAGLL